MSSEIRRGRAQSETKILEAALVIARAAVRLTANDTHESYLANDERRWAIERLLTQFGEALKDLPPGTIERMDAGINWSGPKRFRDIAAHWYTDGLDHDLIWRVLRDELPRCIMAIQTHLEGRNAD